MLSTAVFSRDIVYLKQLIDEGSDVNSKCHGTPLIHLIVTTAALPNGLVFADEAIKFLIEIESLLVTAKDDQGSNILHLCCDYNFPEFIDLFVSKDSENELLIMKDRLGYLPLHRCALKDSLEAGNFITHI